MIKKLIKKVFKIKSNDDFIQTFTKKWVGRLMWFAILSTSFTFGLIALSLIRGYDHRIIVATVDLAKYDIYMIIGVMFFYMVKAYFETYSEEKNKLIKVNSPKEWSDNNNTVTYENDIDDEYGEDEDTGVVDDEEEE